MSGDWLLMRPISIAVKSFDMTIDRFITMSTPLRTFQVDALQVEVYRQEADLVDSLVPQIHSYLDAVIDRQGAAAAILARVPGLGSTARLAGFTDLSGLENLAGLATDFDFS